MKTLQNLPINEKSFSISLKGDTTGQMWVGKFATVCVPNLRQQADASVMEAQLNRDLTTLDGNTKLYHKVIAQLASRLVAAPEWWQSSDSGQNLLDINVVLEVWKNCIEAEKEWRNKVWGEPEEPKVKTTDVEEESKE